MKTKMTKMMMMTKTKKAQRKKEKETRRKRERERERAPDGPSTLPATRSCSCSATQDLAEYLHLTSPHGRPRVV